jgi:hypothetical protein
MSPPGYFSRMRLLAMTAEDAEDFSRALLEIWPDIRFIDHDTGSETVILEEGGYALRPKKHLGYCASLAEPGISMFHVWREPEDWTPLWLGPNKYNVYELPNKPRFNFVYARSLIPRDRPHELQSGRIWAIYLKGDKEHLRFLNKVIRLTAKLTTNVVDVLDRKTGEVTHHSQRTMLWVGHHALEWCGADPARRINEYIRPATEPPAPSASHR